MRVKSALACDVVEHSAPGVEPTNADAQLPGDSTYEYQLTLLERGEWRLGPAVVRQRDTLGLVGRTIESSRTTPALVYPVVHPIANRTVFSGLVERAGSRDRDAFDRLREYSSGDSLRDINWKASARRAADEFVVTEFAAEDGGGITIACEATEGRSHRMASATASIALYLLTAGIVVDLAAPDGVVKPGRGDDQREAVLELLARTDAGSITEAQTTGADIIVTADTDETTVRVNGVDHSFDRLVDTDRNLGPDAGQRTEVAV
jgi:uncharacterized protein (DUF58 family)